MTDALADELERLAKDEDGDPVMFNRLADAVIARFPAILSALREREHQEEQS